MAYNQGGNYGGGDRRGGGGGRNFNQDREMHDAVCADCKQPCKVPFKPSGDSNRPVYCKDCYQKHRPPQRENRY